MVRRLVRLFAGLAGAIVLVSNLGLPNAISATQADSNFARLDISARHECGEQFDIGDGHYRIISSSTSPSIGNAPAPNGVYWIVTSIWNSDRHSAFLPTDLRAQLLTSDGHVFSHNETLTRKLTGTENGFRRIPEDSSVYLGGSAGKDYRILYVFDVPKNVTKPVLTLAEENGKRKFGVQLPCQAAEEDLVPQNVPNDGVITSFGETELIHVGLDKWLVTFESGVEVRTSLAGGSVVPRRGQYLVIWFIQESQSGDPLPMGSFRLRASSSPGNTPAPYNISREGTGALIATEYDWNPQYMESGLPYRTGIVFDIRPEDTHFELSLYLPSNSPWETKPVKILFDA